MTRQPAIPADGPSAVDARLSSRAATVEPAASRSIDPPLDMALNHGTYAPRACLDVLQRCASPTAFRHYSSPDNRELRETIGAAVGVPWECVLVAHGSGPLLRAAIPYVIERRIRESLWRIVQHVVARRGYPMITPHLTYFKVPQGALRLGLRVQFVPLDAARSFRLGTDALSAAISRCPGLVYLSNPNNPTGNVLLLRDELVTLLSRFPQCTFVVDEAYIEYIHPDDPIRVIDLAPHHPNLIVLRSFSFAYGLAALHVGYLVAQQALVKTLEQSRTPYAVGKLAADLVSAALADVDHLPFVRRAMAEQRERLLPRLRRLPNVEAYDSQTNFILCRFTDHRTARTLYDALLERGIKIKIFDPLPNLQLEDYFRITVGLPEENERLLENLEIIMMGR